MTFPLGSGLMRSNVSGGGGGETDPEDPTFFGDQSPSDVGYGYLTYDTHTKIYLQNGVVREIWGARKGSRPSFSNLWGWVDYTVKPNGWHQTHTAGYHWREEPSFSGTDGFYMTRAYNGSTLANTDNTTPGPVDSSWLDDLGIQPPAAGHEDHTGGFSVIIPVGDYEKRTYMRVRWTGSVPQVVLQARLYVSSSFQVVDGVFQRVTNYDVTADAFAGNPVGVANPWGYTEPFVTFHIQQGSAPYDGPADPSQFSDLVTVPMQVSGGDYPIGTTFLDPSGGLDLGFVNGQQGNVGNGDWTDHYCNLDLFGGDNPYLADRPENRWPSETQVPDLEYLFCPFHFGLVFLDGFKHNVVPVSDGASANIGGVEVAYQLAPPWGWDSAHRWYWMDYFEETTGVNLAVMTSSSVEGGVLEIFAGSGEEHDRIYGYRQAVMTVDRDQPDMFYPPTKDWALEFIVQLEGNFAIADVDYTPWFEFFMGGAYISVATGTNEFRTGNISWTGGINWQNRVHVRVLHSSTGWALKAWEDGDDIPSDWTSWEKESTDAFPEPNFIVWQDAGFWFTSYSAVAMKATIIEYTFWDLTGTSTPLDFGPGLGHSPTGGDVDESHAPTGGGGTALPSTMMGSGNPLG